MQYCQLCCDLHLYTVQVERYQLPKTMEHFDLVVCAATVYPGQTLSRFSVIIPMKTICESL